MKKKLRIASFIMLIVALLWIVMAFLTMDVPINIPNTFFDVLRVIYKIYPVVMAGLFIASFFVKDKKQ